MFGSEANIGTIYHFKWKMNIIEPKEKEVLQGEKILKTLDAILRGDRKGFFR